MNENSEIKTSKRRIIGAAFFGLILGGYFYNAFDFSIPRILAIIQKTSIEEAYLSENSAAVLNLFLMTIIMFFAAAVAGFIARKKGTIVGILANLVYIILCGTAFILIFLEGSDVLIGNISAQLYSFVLLLLVVLASIFGGYLGQKYYSLEKDLDLEKDKLTVFGIRWFHYFWIFPFIIYPFLATFIIVTYAGILVALVDLYFAIHPSLWFKISWWFFVFFMPILGVIAMYTLGFAFVRFWELMQYKQTRSKGWGRFGKVLLYGIGLPILAFIIASFVADTAHNMPKPAAGDWKIGLGLLGIIPTIALVVYIFSWLKDKFSRNKDSL